MRQAFRAHSRRLPFAAALLLVATVVPVAVMPSPATAAPVQFTSTVVNAASNLCAGVPGASTANSVQLTQATCSNAAAQSLTFVPVTGATNTYTVDTFAAGKCLDISGQSLLDNGLIIQWSCNSQTNQQFRLQAVTVTGKTNTFNIIGVQSGKCLIPAADSTANNALLVQLTCSTATTRVWQIPSYNSGGTTTPPSQTFTNPLSLHGPDPFLTYYNGFYYMATTTWNNTITMRKSATLGGLKTASDVLIQTLTRSGGNGTMWAPDFHLLNGPDGLRWYFYYVAGAEPFNLNTQRIHVLESAGTDPMGPYTFKADMLDPTQNNTWELDPEILQLNNNLYLLGTFYNGSQPMFIRQLTNPWTAAGTRHILSSPTLSWETIGGAVNEAPAVLQHGGKTFVTFSASHCSTPDYKMGILTYNGTGDPLQSSSWAKSANPVFQRSNPNGVYGPGSNGFFTSPDGTQSWLVYNANNSASGACDMNRTTRVQQFTWNADGTPNFGTPVSLSTAITAPSGEPSS